MKFSNRKENFWETYSKQLASEARRFSDALADSLLGGKRPPGAVPLPKEEQMRRFLLLVKPLETLSPEEAKDADVIWQKHFIGRDEVEVKKWALAMAREYTKLTYPGEEDNYAGPY